MTADRARTQYTICDDCGNPTLEHDKAVWTIDGASYCPTCRPVIDRAALVEQVADLVRFNHDPIAIANEAIDLALEEAALYFDEHADDPSIGSAIRALKDTPSP